MSDNSVAGKHILITGGASGIGAESALLLSKRGANVTIGDLNEADGNALVPVSYTHLTLPTNREV